MSVNPMGLAAFVQQGFEQGTQRREQNGLRALAGDYYEGKVAPENRGLFLSQLAKLGGDPRSYQQDMAGQDKSRQERIGNIATMLLRAPEQYRPQLYKSIVPELQSLGFQNAPQDYTPQLDGLVQQIAELHGGAESVKPMNVAPGGQIVDPASGRVVHSNQNFAPQKPIWDSQRGGFAMPPGQDGTPSAQGGSGPGFLPTVAPRPDYDAQRLQMAQEANARAAEASRYAGDASRRAALGNAPPGYRFNASGSLERIPGGPQEAGKALPAPVVAKLTKQAGIFDNTSDLLDHFQEGYSGNVIGGGLENLAGRLGGERLGLATQGQADWWQQYDRQKNEVRNLLFGSALTPSEQAAFEAADVGPNMAPDRIRKNLEMQKTIISRALSRQAEVWRAQGYNTDAIDAAVMPSTPQQGATQSPPRPAVQKATEGQIVENAEGVRLQLRNGQWQRMN